MSNKITDNNSKPCKESGCNVDIRIESKGDVNIYNCTTQQTYPPHQVTEECPSDPISPGQCIPLAIGSKQKQSQRTKLDRLLNENHVPSALAASFFQVSRRFLAGYNAANDFEQDIFRMFRAFSPDLKRLLSCSVKSYDALKPAERDQLFDSTLPTDPNTPIDADMLATAFSHELVCRVGEKIFKDPSAFEEERPGQNRFFYVPGEQFERQLVVCSINDLRTSQFKPALNPGDYEPREIEHSCQVVLVNGKPEVQCEVKKAPCEGENIDDPGNTCLRVPQVEPGQALVLQGINFISTDMKVRLTAKPPGTITREVDAYVFGDIDTPLTEVINGETVTIKDCRVHDRLTFSVPEDFPPGIYSFELVLPNVTGFPELGDPILSTQLFLRVNPPSSAKYEITAEKLYCRDETGHTDIGSDEVRVHVLSYPVLGEILELAVDEDKKQEFESPEFEMDSHTGTTMNAILFHNDAPISAMFMSIMGYEIDSDKAYREQIDTFAKAFWHYLKIVLKYIAAALVAGAFAMGVKDLVALGLKHPIIALIAAAVTLAVVIFLALWAPADVIIDDSINLTSLELATLTSVSMPPPIDTEYKTHHSITVKIKPTGKSPTEYKEIREYISADEHSRYEIFLRYNRIS